NKRPPCASQNATHERRSEASVGRQVRKARLAVVAVAIDTEVTRFPVRLPLGHRTSLSRLTVPFSSSRSERHGSNVVQRGGRSSREAEPSSRTTNSRRERGSEGREANVLALRARPIRVQRAARTPALPPEVHHDARHGWRGAD